MLKYKAKWSQLLQIVASNLIYKPLFAFMYLINYILQYFNVLVLSGEWYRVHDNHGFITIDFEISFAYKYTKT